MDAPPELEDCRPFLQVASLFRDAGVHVPDVRHRPGAGFPAALRPRQYNLPQRAERRDSPKLYRDANAALVDISAPRTLISSVFTILE